MADPTPQELAAAMRRDSRGMRELRDFLESIRDYDDDAFAEATEGIHRAELMELLEKLTKLLADTDAMIDSLYDSAPPDNG